MSNFDTEVAKAVANGWTPVMVMEGVAVLHGGTSQINHVAHALFSLLTLGLWLPLWFLIAVSSGGKSRQILTLTDTGDKVLWSIKRTGV